MNSKTTLTRQQIEQIAITIGLNQNIHSVTIQQSSPSGIGPDTWVTWHYANSKQDKQSCLTDVSNW